MNWVTIIIIIVLIVILYFIYQSTKVTINNFRQFLDYNPLSNNYMQPNTNLVHCRNNQCRVVSPIYNPAIVANTRSSNPAAVFYS